MNSQLKEKIQLEINAGRFSEFISEVKDLLKGTYPFSTENDINEFLESTVYVDFIREMQAWQNDMEELIISGQSEWSIEYLRGCVIGIQTAMRFPTYLKEQIEMETDEKSD
jgi:hypothetical protein